MVVVAKPGKIRIYLDPQELNKVIQRPKYQMPTLEEAKIFSTLDAKDGFYQISLDQASSELTTFWTPFGRYRYLRMPFGVSLAPEEFESNLQEKLADLEGVEVIRDDIIVMGFGETQEQAVRNHDENLLKLLERARKVNLRLNSKKMEMKKSEVKFMGHLISKDGLKPDPAKVKAVEEMPQPSCKQEVLSLLGFVNYLSRFLPRLADVAQPLRDLTTKNAKYTWAKQHDTVFQEVKKLVVNHPVLKYYDCSAEVTLQCDASEKGLGAVLLQNGQPIAFASKTLTDPKIRTNRERMSCNCVRLLEVQSVPFQTGKDHSRIRSQASASNFQEICLSSPMQIAKDVAPPSKVQFGCNIQTRFPDVHHGSSVQSLLTQPRR